MGGGFENSFKHNCIPCCHFSLKIDNMVYKAIRYVNKNGRYSEQTVGSAHPPSFNNPQLAAGSFISIDYLVAVWLAAIFLLGAVWLSDFFQTGFPV